MLTEESRRSLKDQMVQTQLESKHTENCRLVPDRNMMLDRMPENGIVAEIGVAYGDFSAEILTRSKPKQLHLIDAWATDRYQAGLVTIKLKFSELIKNESVVIHQGISTDILPTFTDGFFDWVYIDTNHTFETTVQELEIALAKVKVEGRIAGHDFCTGNAIKPVPYGVVEAVTKFCKDHDWQFEFLTVESRGHFSFCLKKIG